MHSLKLILSNPRYFAPAWVFASINIMTGAWVLHIPHVKEKLALNDSQLGLALFFFALGVLTFLPVTPYVSKQFGIGRCTVFGVVLFAISYTFPLLAPDYIALCICLFVSGLFCGATEVSMNALVSEIEKTDRRNFMSAAHGFFSLGGALGAGIGSLFLAFGVRPTLHMITMGVFIVLTNFLLAKHYRRIKEKETDGQKSSYDFKSLKPLIGLALIAFFIMCCEGANEHWSNLYLLEVVQIEAEHLAGLGFLLFSIAMTIGRFFGDYISERLGSLKIILGGCLIGVLGYALILYDTLIVTSTGFAILGLGLSVIIPELFRLAGKTEGVSASLAISFVSGIGFVGFLSGPVVLGQISYQIDLKASFVFLLVLVLGALFISVLIWYRRRLSQKKLSESIQ